MSFSNFIYIAVCLITTAASLTGPDPPLWPETFQQDFIQSDSRVTITATGKLWYDSKNNRQRMDFKPDYYDALCQSVGQYNNTSCNQIIINDALYVYLPEKNLCCKCCTAAQGCTIEPRDWLKDFKYVGEEDVKGQKYDKWTFSGENYLASENDNHTPRRIESQIYSIDFVSISYSEESISQAVFQLPTMCNTDCPKQTVCSTYTQGKEKYSIWKSLLRKITNHKAPQRQNLEVNISTQ